MAKKVGKNTNLNDTTTLSAGISVSGTTSTTILAAQAPGDQPRIKVILTNDSNHDMWVKFQAASVDNDKKGFLVYRNSTVTLMEDGDTYSGEISAITKTAATSTAFVTDY